MRVSQDTSLSAGPTSARWESQRFLAASVQVLVALIPLGVGFAVASLLARHLEPTPGTGGTVLWWLVVLGSATVASHFAERSTRRLAPLPALLRSTMVFPDRAPSRFRMALATRDSDLLRRQLDEATKTGHTDLAHATEVILSLAQELSSHDRNTRGHSERTGAYADLIAKEMGLRTDDRDKLRWAAVLHDIGKLETPSAILNQPGSLTPAQFEVIKKHPESGMRIIAPIKEWLGPFADGVGQHHERWDGTGYPLGLAGNEISLAARIISVADAYDVMTTGRFYQAKVSHAAARREIADKSGSQFDPRVARALLNLSLGRLRWVSGPLAALADPRLLRPLELIGRDVATVLAAGAISVGIAATTVNQVDFGNSPISRPGPTVEAAAAGSLGDRSSDDTATATTESTTAVSSTTHATTTTRLIVTPTTTLAPVAPSTTATTSTSTTSPATTTTAVPATTAPSGLSAVDDSAQTRPSDKVNIAVVANDAGANPVASLSVIRLPAHGTVRIFVGGKIRYDAGDFVGVDTFDYEVCNQSGACGTATVTITIAG